MYYLVENPEDRFSLDEAHIVFVFSVILEETTVMLNVVSSLKVLENTSDREGI